MIDLKKQQRVFVVDTKYTHSSKLIEWIVRFEDGNEIVLAWPSEDLITAYNIKGNVEPHHIEKFCADVKGRYINMTVSGISQGNVSIRNMTTDQIDKLSKELDQYPFGDVLEQMPKKENK